MEELSRTSTPSRVKNSRHGWQGLSKRCAGNAIGVDQSTIVRNARKLFMTKRPPVEFPSKNATTWVVAKRNGFAKTGGFSPWLTRTPHFLQRLPGSWFFIGRILKGNRQALQLFAICKSYCCAPAIGYITEESSKLQHWQQISTVFSTRRFFTDAELLNIYERLKTECLKIIWCYLFSKIRQPGLSVSPWFFKDIFWNPKVWKCWPKQGSKSVTKLTPDIVRAASCKYTHTNL